jgi:DNA-binding CsgD family transcriptional regulator
MTESAARDGAIEALSLGAFDVVEKPINFQLLFHSVRRALGVQRNELQLRKTSEDLERFRDDLLIYKSRLEKRNKQLVETNKALSVLAQNIETTRIETEKEIVLKIRCLIMPTIEKLQQNKNSGPHQTELNMLFRHVEDLTSGLSNDLKIATLLTSSELRIASLVKNGLTTEEIASQLHISPSTVKTHRRNIRKKLGINRKHYSLRDYIDSKANLWIEARQAH